VERLTIGFGIQVRVLRILVCTHCRPLLTAPLDPVSPQFLRDFDARSALPPLLQTEHAGRTCTKLCVS
jgi:hypothetical protein